MNKEKAANITEKELDTKVKNISEIPEGLNTIYDIETTDDKHNKLIIKFKTGESYGSSKFETEPLKLEELKRNTKIPVPKVLATNLNPGNNVKPYFIMDKIKGENPDHIKEEITREQREKILNEYGFYLSELHEFYKFNEYGLLEKNNNSLEIEEDKGEWKEWFKHMTNHRIEYIEDTVFSKNTEAMKTYLEENIDLLDKDYQPVQLREDNRLDNIIVDTDDKSINGFIDWGDHITGEKHYDLVQAEYLLIDWDFRNLNNEEKNQLRKQLYKGYQSRDKEFKIDEQFLKKRRLYLVSSCSWLMMGFPTWSQGLDQEKKDDFQRIIQRRFDEIIQGKNLGETVLKQL